MLLSKDNLRKTALQRRMAIPLAQQVAASLAFTTQFLNAIALSPEAIVAGYWPMRGEMNVIPLLRALAAQGIPTALPRTYDRQSPLDFLQWRDDTPMVRGNFAGIFEPDAAVSPLVKPTVLIIPMLGFDAAGNRLGYGAGHYDRTIALLNPVLKIGAAYTQQQFDSLPAEAHDYKMDAIITEGSVLRFT